MQTAAEPSLRGEEKLFLVIIAVTTTTPPDPGLGLVCYRRVLLRKLPRNPHAMLTRTQTPRQSCYTVTPTTKRTRQLRFVRTLAVEFAYIYIYIYANFCPNEAQENQHLNRRAGCQAQGAGWRVQPTSGCRGGQLIGRPWLLWPANLERLCSPSRGAERTREPCLGHPLFSHVMLIFDNAGIPPPPCPHPCARHACRVAPGSASCMGAPLE